MSVSKEEADQLTMRVGMMSLIYYPEIHVDQPAYSLTDDVAWCLESITDDQSRDELRDAVGRVIVDPSAGRSRLSDLLFELRDTAE